MLTQLRPAIVSFAALTLLTGVVYPAVVTGVAKVCFARQAGGSLIERDGISVGSTLIAQPFTDPRYFWPRPSAAGANGYDAANGSGSNLGPSNPALVDAVRARIDALRAADPDNHTPVPVDLVTASGSGLDPHVSIAAARFQLARVAKARGRSEAEVEQLIAAHTDAGGFGILGEPVVNVLELNLALDAGSNAEAPSPSASATFQTTRDRGMADASH